MNLSPAMRRTLTELRDAHDKEDWDNAELVADFGSCYLGTRRISYTVLKALVRLMALSRDDGGGAEHYTINETGRMILADETQIEPLMRALSAGGAYTWKDGKLIPIGSKP